MARYFVEEPCEHGQMEPHKGDTWNSNVESLVRVERCPGGSRRELTDVQIVEPRYVVQVFDEVTGSYRNIRPGRYAIIPLSGDTE